MMNTWPLDRQGFACHYLVSGPRVEPYESEFRDANLLRFEGALRKHIATHAPVPEAGKIKPRESSRLGLPWRFQGGADTAFVNLSSFYSTMQRVRFDAVATLFSPADQTVSALIWSYAAVDVYCNGLPLAQLAQPVYKPIQRLEVSLPLRSGENQIYLACETLGVRDTRSVVGLQILNAPDIAVTLPDPALAAEIHPALAFLEGMALTKTSLFFPSPAPEGAELSFHGGYEPDHAKAHRPRPWQQIAGISSLPLPPDVTYLTVRVRAGGGFVSRRLERAENILPQPGDATLSREENFRLILRRIADIENFDRGEDFGFPICNLLARKALNAPLPQDDQLFDSMLELIAKRVDCADFLVCGLLRYLKNYPLSPAQAARVKETLTGWRYWMDQDGFDGMCFWSENHCLMFYASALLAGEMYPEADFPLARRTGRQLQAWGREMILRWLEDVEAFGFEEFHSTVYMCVTLAALLNVIDYAEEEISRRAAQVTDGMLRLLATHTFRGGIIAPQGRVYRGALYPFQAGAMALMNAADPAQPWDLGEGWLAFLATSKYEFPQDMASLMAQEAKLSYTSGNARILLEKHADWCLTSVQIPREPFSRWPNIARNPEADPASHAFVKSFNECFHGTTCFQPGVYGYQQHLWYAALDGEAVIFINHPGSTSEGGDLRPGYWHGNGVFPALKQQKNLLGLVYRIPQAHPIHYIHLYCPEARFDEVRQEGAWLFLRKGQGYLGLWASAPMEPWHGMNFHCERRMWGDETACLCVCGGREFENLESFARYAQGLSPAWNSAEGLLSAEGFALAWTPGQDATQYL
ncbi:MAG: hypothetical protein IJ188_04725 [Clostridia bacterium]|nr:hypothetical protein [Clostridia bacterium]